MHVMYDSNTIIPIKIWADDVEDNAMGQAINLSNLPFAFHHIALMPDCHSGYGMPIGGVLATQDVVIPNAVGVDIGCGMCSIKTSINSQELDVATIKTIMGAIRDTIPVGFKHNSKAQDKDLMPEDSNHPTPVIDTQYDSALEQLGTLGGGNHFIELQKDSSGFMYIMIHSGSRNLGKKVADYYNKAAVELNEKWYSRVPKSWELAFLPINSEMGQLYLTEMNYCVEFALANRRLMMNKICAIVNDITGCEFEPMINIAHNYAKMEHHFGKNVMVHRKGATLARPDTIGIIPGSQGTKSYIVRGKGNPDSFESCSHGAGRRMGRKEAERTLNLEDEIRKLDEQGIIHSVRQSSDLDEAAGAYKDISIVMANQSDLVEIITELTPMAVIKG